MLMKRAATSPKAKGRHKTGVLSTRLSTRSLGLIVFATLSGIIGTYLLAVTHAATPTTSTEAESGTIAAPASVVADAQASGGQAVKFTTGSGSSGSCQTAANTPGGTDPWGGCFPGAFNTGYPHGLAGDTRTPVTLTAYTGSCTVGAGTTVVIDSKNVDCSSQGLFVYGTLTIKNSLVSGVVFENSNSAVLTLMDTEVDGGNQLTFPSIGGGLNITAIRVNTHGGQHTIQCYGSCDVEDSWMHDQTEGGTAPHQNGFLSNDGSHIILKHNSAYCSTTGCTSDIAFTDDGLTSDVLIDKNLMVASPGSSYCLGVGSVPSKGNPEYQITVTNNVWQRGANNKCATFGPTYGWDATNNVPGTTGYQNAWSGNTWADGTTLDHP